MVPSRGRADRIRDAVSRELLARWPEIETSNGLSSVTIIVTLDARGRVRRTVWRTEAVRVDGGDEREATNDAE